MPTRQSRATKIIIDGKRLLVCSPYNADFVTELKAGIPYGSRRWDSDARYWEVDDQYLDAVKAMLRNHYGAEPTIQHGRASGPRNAQDAANEDARRRARAEQERARAERERAQQARENAERIRQEFRSRFGFGFDDSDPFGRHYADDDGPYSYRQKTQTPPATSGLTWADRMFMDLPEELHKSVYMALVKSLHPDRAGDAGTEAMKIVNKARDTHGKF